jgi:hypothetical protein
VEKKIIVLAQRKKGHEKQQAEYEPEKPAARSASGEYLGKRIGQLISLIHHGPMIHILSADSKKVSQPNREKYYF